MEDNLDEMAEEGKVDLVNDEGQAGIPPEAAGFSIAKQKAEFLSGSSESKQVVPSTPEGPQKFINQLLAADQASEGRLLLSIPQADGESVKLMRTAEYSKDRLPRTSLFGFDKQGFIRITGPMAEELVARERSGRSDAHRFGQPIDGTTFEELLANSQGVVDDERQETEVAHITGDNPDDIRRMESNIKANLVLMNIEMGAKRDLVDNFKATAPSKGTVGAQEALRGALGQRQS